MKSFLKILAWSILGIALLIIGFLGSTVKLLKPERLTPLTVEIANRALNADVAISNVELELRSSFPFLNLSIDSLTVISRDIKQLPQATRDTLPAWADTLATVDRIHGGINLLKAITGKIALNDVEIDAPGVNILVVNDQLNNFSISKSQEEESETTVEVPDISIKSFVISNPRLLRYVDLTTDTRLEARLSTAEIISQEAAPSDLPTYCISLDTNIESPLFSLIGLQDIPIDFNGNVEWSHERPFALTLANFKFAVSLLSGMLSTKMDFTDNLTIEAFEFDVNPLSVSEVLDIIPDSASRELGIPKGIVTTAAVAVRGRLNKPYVAGTAMLPDVDVTIDIPDCMLQWQKIDIRNFELLTNILLRGDQLDDAQVEIDKLYISGPATSIDIQGRIANMITDPLFDGSVNGKVRIDKLPPVLLKYLDGAYARGTISMATDMQVRKSMFSRENFHKLKLRGSIEGRNLYYLAPDTQTMFLARIVNAKFGTNESLSREADNGDKRKLDSLLTATIAIDTTRILFSGIDVKVNQFKLGVGALNKKASSDTTAIIPMGGKLSVGMFSLFTLSDSAGVRVRDLNGSVGMMRYKGDTHLPLFTLSSSIGRISAGDNSTRFMVSKSKLNARLNKLPDTELSKSRREIRHIADSIHKTAPDLPIDSVYDLAMQIRRRNSKRKGQRALSLPTDNAAEIIDWGTSKSFQRFLTDWKLTGTLTADRAGLFSAAFPIRNRVKNLNLHFNNDSIVLDNVEYKAGHSDFLISGSVSNMVRAFASRKKSSPMKINFDLLSDTIDVNQLAHAFFTGAANTHVELDGDLDNEAALEHSVAAAPTDSVGPLLIPVNIDAELQLKANNVLYSDFILHNLSGTVLAYDGALNLHDLKASSDVGKIDLSALYSAPTADDMKFGFGMELQDFNIRHFLNLVPAMDTIMPLMRDLGGIINAKVAATSDIDRNMNIVIPTLHAAISLEGDSLVVLDEPTFKKISKWLLFKDKNNNMIKHMSVEMIVEDNTMQLFPFVFDFDRYRLGVQGRNDLDMNFDYHIAILKSPLPFRFGINVRGNADKFKVRLGRARFNEKSSAQKISIADTTRVNLIRQFENVFRRGVRNSDFARINIGTKPEAANLDLNTDTLTSADSLYFMKEGLIPIMNPADSLRVETAEPDTLRAGENDNSPK